MRKRFFLMVNNTAIDEFEFALSSAFRDALALTCRYGLTQLQSPAFCGSGVSFYSEHTASSPKGGFPSIRHNEISDSISNLLTKLCTNIRIEPILQPFTGEVFIGASLNNQDGTHLDTAANGFCGGRFQRTFIDVRVFNPMCPLTANAV